MNGRLFALTYASVASSALSSRPLASGCLRKNRPKAVFHLLRHEVFSQLTRISLSVASDNLKHQYSAPPAHCFQ